MRTTTETLVALFIENHTGLNEVGNWSVLIVGPQTQINYLAADGTVRSREFDVRPGDTAIMPLQQKQIVDWLKEITAPVAG